MRRIVGISGNIRRPSRTRHLVGRVLDGAARAGLGATALHDVVDAGPSLGTAVSRVPVAPELDRIYAAIETCDALVVGTPVYKGSYAGMFKHLFDLLDKDALRGRPVLLTATGRLPEYADVIDGRMRPLFGFFDAAVLPGGLYACDLDFAGGAELPSSFDDRIAAAVGHLGSALEEGGR